MGVKAIIYSGGNVVGYHNTPDVDEFTELGAQFDLVEKVPDIILHTPVNKLVVRVCEGEYELKDIPPVPPPEQEIAQLKAENLTFKLKIAELGAAAEQDKIDMQLALVELAAIVTGGAE